MSVRQKLTMMMEFTKLHKNFQKYFRIVPALTDELTEDAYRVRHQVYCEELGWEPVREDGMETDEFDKHSMHCLLQNASTGEYIGCIRTVKGNPENPLVPLPFQSACINTLNPGIPNPELQVRYAVAEVSRLAVIGKYRRRPQEQDRAVKISDDDFGSIVRPRFPYIPVGLYMGMLEMARRSGIETLYILTEPSLAAHFCKLGGKLECIGGSIEHRGTRAPYQMDVDNVIGKMNILMKPLFKVICNEIDQAYKDHSSGSLKSA
ncbi:MAG: PEP-CTERM/exosortase system-associated acyltransferase [Motiliproteus sp.]|nr:PEP-CTERM/exosortase system-associated acyltransferase [Motiliproteus sp.]MCW9051554.1 PEP-CTERM/exosortase system-associated acyltransferase [Motiliproteus sp.]